MEPVTQFYFDHEKLEVYQQSIAFVAWLNPILEEISKAGDVKDQLDRASTSIPLNIAEGNGKYSGKERGRYFETAQASALECASGLDILIAKRKLTSEQIVPGKERLSRIVRMLVGLLKKCPDRNYDRGSREEP
ncbi:MAG TPA: four helix bundle protein [Isosphaeraceae bacterium]|nr:four helix bundle protein [Isosphaeraceae bacterium]